VRIVRRIGVFSVLALTLAAGCITMGTPGAGASGLTYGTLPGPHGTPINGGTVTIANPPGAGPTYILPIVPESDFTVSTIDQFQDFSWRPLWWSPKGDQPEVDYSAAP
jgi:peptide/nickel transport system substrate-binding protein